VSHLLLGEGLLLASLFTPYLLVLHRSFNVGEGVTTPIVIPLFPYPLRRVGLGLSWVALGALDCRSLRASECAIENSQSVCELSAAMTQAMALVVQSPNLSLSCCSQRLHSLSQQVRSILPLNYPLSAIFECILFN